jgi:hypothetical protein
VAVVIPFSGQVLAGLYVVVRRGCAGTQAQA